MRSRCVFPWLLLLTTKTMMDSAFSTCFFFFFSFYIFTIAANANQADVLLRMMRSKWSPAAQEDEQFRLRNSSKELPAVYVAPQHGLKDLDKIDRLPGQPEGQSINQYAGYVTVDHHNGRALFYYFVESPEDQAKKPLVLWLNGGDRHHYWALQCFPRSIDNLRCAGPGCSSLGYGAMEELGPFRVKSDGKTLRENDHSWIDGMFIEIILLIMCVLEVMMMLQQYELVVIQLQWQTSSSWSLLLVLDSRTRIPLQITAPTETEEQQRTPMPSWSTGWRGFRSTRAMISSSPERATAATTFLSSPVSSSATT